MKKPEYAVVMIDGVIRAYITSSLDLWRMGHRRVLEHMFNNRWDPFVYAVAFHAGYRDFSDEEVSKKVERWDSIRRSVLEYMCYMAQDVFFSSDYKFHHWLSEDTLVLKLYHDSATFSNFHR